MTLTVLAPISALAVAVALLGAPAASQAAAQARAYDPTEKSILDLQADLKAGRVTSVELVEAYDARIAALNPKLHAVIALNPEARAQAAALDAARARGAATGPLFGIPILLKDNIESRDPVATTAGSLALADNVTARDSGVSERLRAAGAIVLGKANLSEWANIRSNHSISGWSGVGGQTRNPYALDRNTCGSSSGSGAGAAASLAAAAVGTETDGSVTCPSAVNGLVGLKPTVGLVSRRGVVPISHSQDTPGPMARTVMDAAILMEAMAGTDPADPATAGADAHRGGLVAALRPGALKGIRVGVLRYNAGFHPETDRVFNAALSTMSAAGAVLVDIAKFPTTASIGAFENVVLMTELKADLNAYLATTRPSQVPSRTLADLIAFNRAHADVEMPLFGQEEFLAAQARPGLDDPAYVAALASARRFAGAEGLDKLLADNQVDVLVAPTLGPAWLIDPVLKDRFVGGGVGQAPAVAGYPHLTVPMGAVDGLPVGLSFVGPAWSEAKLLAYGYAFEQATQARRPPQLPASVTPEPKGAWEAVNNAAGERPDRR